VEDVGNHLGEIKLRWLGHLERTDETNLVKRVRKKEFQNKLQLTGKNTLPSR